MSEVTVKQLARAVKKAQKMDMQSKELLCDKIYIEQPCLLASVVVQKQMGNTMEDVDVLVNILIVLYLSLKESNREIAMITEQDQDYQLTMLYNSIIFAEGMNNEMVASSVEQYIANHKEPVLLAYVVDTMLQNGFHKNQADHSKYLLLAGMNLVECIANAKILK